MCDVTVMLVPCVQVCNRYDHITTTAKIENIIIILFESDNMAHTHANKRQTDRQLSCHIKVISVRFPIL